MTPKEDVENGLSQIEPLSLRSNSTQGPGLFRFRAGCLFQNAVVESEKHPDIVFCAAIKQARLR